MLKRFVGAICGVVAAVLIIYLVELAGARLFPAAADVARSGSLAGVPPGALLLVVAGWTIGTAVGAWVAVAIAKVSWPAWVVAAIVVLGVVANAAIIPHPLWMVAAGIILPLAMAWLVGRSARRTDEPAAEQAV